MYKIIDRNTPIFGEVDENAQAQILASLDSLQAAYGVVCADGHKGYCSMPVGGAIAYRYAISPSGVGHDIACGNKAVLTDAPAPEVRKNIRKIMDDIYNKAIPFGIGTINAEPAEHPVLDEDIWKVPWLAPLHQLALNQLGSVGAGNHYVDIFSDELDRIWVGVHFGSRGVGFKIASHFFERVGAKDGPDVPPLVWDIESGNGQEYLASMELAGRFAYAGRDIVCETVAKKILGASILDEVHNHHNFAWEENHFGEKLWVVRKGSTPNMPGQKSFVGGSMGDSSFILEGVDSETSRLALHSTVHGAGRIMGRQQAAGKIKWLMNPELGRKVPTRIREGCVSPEMMRTWLDEKEVCLAGGGLDESPHCYKRIDDVLSHHKDTLKIIHRLEPIGVAMAGEKDFDPYKD